MAFRGKDGALRAIKGDKRTLKASGTSSKGFDDIIGASNNVWSTATEGYCP